MDNLLMKETCTDEKIKKTAAGSYSGFLHYLNISLYAGKPSCSAGLVCLEQL